MLLDLRKTAMQAIYESTSLDIIRDLSQSLADDKPVGESFTQHHGIHKAVQEINFSDNTQKMMSKYHDSYVAYQEWMNQRTYSQMPSMMDISKMGNFNMSVNQSIDIIVNLVKSMKDGVYGALLVGKKGKTFNLLHPVIMHEILDETSRFNREEEVYTLAIYTWKDVAQAKAMFPNLYEHNDEFQTEIAGLLVSLNSPAEYIIENTDFNVDIVNDEFVLNYAEKKKHKDTGKEFKDNSKAGRSFIVPCQILNISGIAFPYYGSVYSKKGVAWNITPMKSANISPPSGDTHRDLAGGSRICTHSGDSKTQKGISALNHANTTSPLNKYILHDGAFDYAYTCLVSAIGLYSEGFEVEVVPVVEKAKTFQEFLEINPEATKKDYLRYVRDRLRDKMEPIRDEADEAEAQLAEADVDAEMTIIEHEPGRRYVIGQIVRYEGIIYRALRGTRLVPGNGVTAWEEIRNETERNEEVA